LGIDRGSSAGASSFCSWGSCATCRGVASSSPPPRKVVADALYGCVADEEVRKTWGMGDGVVLDLDEPGKLVVIGVLYLSNRGKGRSPSTPASETGESP
jgi:hypothetical protein